MLQYDAMRCGTHRPIKLHSVRFVCDFEAPSLSLGFIVDGLVDHFKSVIRSFLIRSFLFFFYYYFYSVFSLRLCDEIRTGKTAFIADWLTVYDRSITNSFIWLVIVVYRMW